MKKQVGMALGVVIISQLLAACGSSDSTETASGGTPAPAPAPAPNPAPAPAPTNAFTESATWTVNLPAVGDSICYDFDSKTSSAACSGNAWDLKLTKTARSTRIASNSGASGTGGAGAYGGPSSHTWTDLQTWQNGTTTPAGDEVLSYQYEPDAASTAFTGSNSIKSAAFEYNIGGAHQLFPTYRTFLVTGDSSAITADSTAQAPVYAVQVTGYYGGSAGTESGHISLQWIDRAAPTTLRDITLDATAGWAYLDLSTGAVSSATGTWHIAFNRYRAMLNGGESGSGTVAGFAAKTPAGFYDTDGMPVLASFQGATPETMKTELVATDLAVPSAQNGWVIDGITSPLMESSTGTYPGPLSYGWYTYFPTAQAATDAGLPAVAHLLKANADQGTLLRSGEGDSYARVRMTAIDYTDLQDANSDQRWTFEFDVQPAAAAN